MSDVESHIRLPESVPLGSRISLDAISKSVAAIVLAVYGCGFLITSIHSSSFGFMETSPFRPKVAAAGVWFLIFLIIPIALVVWLWVPNPRADLHGKWLRRLSTRCFFYVSLSVAFGNTLERVFDYQVENQAHDPFWLTFAPLLAMIPCMSLLVLDQIERFPKIIAPLATAALVLFLFAFGYRETFVRHRFSEGAITNWFLGIGATFVLTLITIKRMGSSILEPNTWPMAVGFALSAVLSFGSIYYPHIKSPWGGGAPIPVTLYFTKESVLMPGQSVSALLLDESDAGLFVVGKSDKNATYIPRNAVGLIFYSDDGSGFSLPRPK